MTKKIVVVGGGVGGVASSLMLADEIRSNRLDAEVLLVSKSEYHYMPPLWLDVAVDGLDVEKTRAPLRGVEYYGVKTLIDEVVSIDLAEREIATRSGRRISYDYLLIALGTVNGWSEYPGLEEAGWHNYDPESARAFNRAIKTFRGGRIVVLVPELPHRCGIYPLEITTLLAHYYKVKGVKVDIKYVAPRSMLGYHPLDILGPDIGRLAREILEGYGVEVIVHKGLERVDPEKRVVVTKDAEIEYDMLVKVPPPRLPPLLRSPDFQLGDDKRFTRIRTPHFQHPEYDEVYLTGEHSMKPAGLGLAGVFVHFASIRAASMILEDLGSVYSLYDYPPVHCVAYIGNGGLIGSCEVTYDEGKGHYRWNDRCYVTLRGPMVKILKRTFYMSWLGRLRFPHAPKPSLRELGVEAHGG